METARASLAYRTRQLERVKQLAAQGAIEQRLVDEEDRTLAEARNDAGMPEAALKSARARLKSAEAYGGTIQCRAQRREPTPAPGRHLPPPLDAEPIGAPVRGRCRAVSRGPPRHPGGVGIGCARSEMRTILTTRRKSRPTSLLTEAHRDADEPTDFPPTARVLGVRPGGGRRRRVFLWRLAPRPAIGREDRQEEASRAREGHRAVAEAELALALARRDAAALGVKIAEAHAAATASEREYREKQHGRIAELEKRGAVDRLLVDEEDERVRGARAAERAAALSVDVHRARRAPPRRRSARPRPSTTSPGSGRGSSWRSRPRTNWRTPGPSGPTPSIASREPRPRRPAPRPSGNTARRNPTGWPCWPARTPSSGGWSTNRRTDTGPRRPTSVARRPKVDQARASVAIAEAAVHAAEARRDLARAVSRLAGDPGAEREPEPLKAAMTRLRRARVDRARSERDAARLEVDRAEAEAERDRATVAFRTRQVERVKQLAARKAVEGRLVDEHELAVDESRHFQREAEAGIKSARAASWPPRPGSRPSRARPGE